MNNYYYPEANLGRYRVMKHIHGNGDEVELDFLSNYKIAVDLASTFNRSHWSVRPPGMVPKP